MKLNRFLKLTVCGAGALLISGNVLAVGITQFIIQNNSGQDSAIKTFMCSGDVNKYTPAGGKTTYQVNQPPFSLFCAGGNCSPSLYADKKCSKKIATGVMKNSVLTITPIDMSYAEKVEINGSDETLTIKNA